MFACDTVAQWLLLTRYYQVCIILLSLEAWTNSVHSTFPKFILMYRFVHMYVVVELCHQIGFQRGSMFPGDV